MLSIKSSAPFETSLHAKLFCPRVILNDVSLLPPPHALDHVNLYLYGPLKLEIRALSPALRTSNLIFPRLFHFFLPSLITMCRYLENFMVNSSSLSQKFLLFLVYVKIRVNSFTSTNNITSKQYIYTHLNKRNLPLRLINSNQQSAIQIIWKIIPKRS